MGEVGIDLLPSQVGLDGHLLSSKFFKFLFMIYIFLLNLDISYCRAINSKCLAEECLAMISGSIDHGHCAIHRPCNSNGLYDPEACESCIKNWSNIIGNPGLAHASRKV